MRPKQVHIVIIRTRAKEVVKTARAHSAPKPLSMKREEMLLILLGQFAHFVVDLLCEGIYCEASLIAFTLPAYADCSLCGFLLTHNE